MCLGDAKVGRGTRDDGRHTRVRGKQATGEDMSDRDAGEELMGVDLRGKRVLVTGGSSGLGAALAEGFARRGAIVGICARRADRLDEVLQRLQVHSPDSRAWTVDLSDFNEVAALAVTCVEEFGGLDLLVNNAGIPKRRWAWAHRPDEISDVLRLNLESPIRLTLGLLDELVASEGAVIFIGSVAARLSPPSEAVYAASKAGITALAESLRVDLAVAGKPVRVHVVQPGVLDTELFGLADNDAPIADIEALAAGDIVEPVLEMMSRGNFEQFVPAWFADIPPIKANDLDGFLQGSVEYTVTRLRDLGRTAS